MPPVRRLAAILAADVAGYSRMMGADEEATHERLKGHLQALIGPKIAQHRGRIVKNTGDVGASGGFALPPTRTKAAPSRSGPAPRRGHRPLGGAPRGGEQRMVLARRSDARKAVRPVEMRARPVRPAMRFRRNRADKPGPVTS